VTATTTGTVTLRTALDTYGHTKFIKDGTIASPRVHFDFVDLKPMHKAFSPMAMRQEYDLSEIAIATFLQALAYDKPIVLLPLVMLNRFHHGSIVRRSDRALAPEQLNGTRIGVRSYTQTTGTWVRGILHAEYGVDLDSITWVTTEGGHVTDYHEPPNVVRAPAGSSLKEMLLSGEIDAWIAGRDAPNIPEIAPVVADSERVEIEWFDQVGALPINHMVCLKATILDEYPWIAQELFSLFKAGKARYLDALAKSGATDAEEAFRVRLLQKGIDPLPFGMEALRTSLETVIDYAFAQHLIPRRYAVEDLFDPRIRALT